MYLSKAFRAVAFELHDGCGHRYPLFMSSSAGHLKAARNPVMIMMRNVCDEVLVCRVGNASSNFGSKGLYYNEYKRFLMVQL
jgi:hypothetical protein